MTEQTSSTKRNPKVRDEEYALNMAAIEAGRKNREQRRYQVSKVEAADGRTWAIFDTTGDADTPAGICDRHVFRWAAEQHANALENIWTGIQETWPACDFDGCNEPSAAGGAFCAEHQAEHEANMRDEAPLDLAALHAADIRNGMGLAADIEDPADNDDAVDIYQRIDNSLVDCLASIGQQASKALGVDRSDADAIERLSSYLDAISRLQRHADHLLKEIAELS